MPVVGQVLADLTRDAAPHRAARSGVVRITSLVPTLSSLAYTDPDVFAAKQERICEQTWTYVARAADLDAPGAFRTVVVGRESAVLVRGCDSALRAFLNVPAPRCRLCIEPEEQVRCLQFPHHALTYALTDELIAAPSTGCTLPPCRTGWATCGSARLTSRRRSTTTCSARLSPVSATLRRSIATGSSTWLGRRIEYDVVPVHT